MQNDHPELNEIEQLKILCNSLEQRLVVLENKFSQIKTTEKIPGPVASEPEPVVVSGARSNESIEYNIGEYGMAWMGNIVLLFGLVFLFQYLQSAGLHIFSYTIGFASVILVFFLSYLLRKSFGYMANLFYYTGHLLLYFITLRLYFFTSDPLISNKYPVLFLLLGVLAFQTYAAVKKRSQVFGGLVLLLLLITAIISNTTHFLLSMTVLTSLLLVYFITRQGWTKLVIPFLTLIYLVHLIWLLNNPIMGNPSGGLTSHQYGYVYLFGCGLIFSLLVLLPRKENFQDNLMIAAIIWNAIGFTMVLLLTVMNFFTHDYTRIFAFIAVFCLAYSFVLQAKVKLKIASSIYALYAFVSISVTIYGIYKLPDSYFLLSLQSLLVVSMALWFRSRFIVIMNAFLFVSLLIAYLNGAESHDSINFAFALVALITARIINLKQHRLKIETEFLRNVNLIIGFLMSLYSLYHAVPKSWVTVSWILTGILFFVLSILIKNVKYRWLAIASMVSSAIYLFLVDLSKVSIGYRVVAFLFLAAISLSVSIYYAKRLKSKKETV